MATEVVMPQMGESIAEGTITKWLKNVGDHVDRDEPLFEISTDKVDAEIPSPAAGTLTEVRYKEGDTVEVNTVVAVLDGNGAAPPAKESAKEEAAAAPASPAEVSSPPAPAETSTTARAEATAPSTPAKPEPAATVERPKPVITSAPAPAAPAAHKTEVKILVKKGETGASKATPPPVRSVEGATAEELRRTKSSPLVRKIASEHNIDIQQLEGTGMSGRVTKNDILSFIESGSPAPQTAAAPVKTQPVAPPLTQPVPATKPAEGDRVEQMTVMRKKIAEHMVMSRRTSAHVSTVYEIDMSKIAKLRDENRAARTDRIGKIGAELQPSLGDVAIDDLVQARLVDRDFPLLQRVDFLGIDVDADDIVAEISETCAGNQADVACADDRDIQGENPTMCGSSSSRAERRTSGRVG